LHRPPRPVTGTKHRSHAFAGTGLEQHPDARRSITG
jgi:hypothetical protein